MQFDHCVKIIQELIYNDSCRRTWPKIHFIRFNLIVSASIKTSSVIVLMQIVPYLQINGRNSLNHFFNQRI